ncbi:MAG: Hpt domain-containing protein [Bacteroidia bacterium]
METNKVTDLSYLRQLANGSDEFMETMSTLFMEETPLTIENMEASCLKSDWKAIKAMAHKMKPSFGFMGIASMKELIEELEKEAESASNPDLIMEKIISLKVICRSAINELRQDLKTYHKPLSRL